MGAYSKLHYHKTFNCNSMKFTPAVLILFVLFVVLSSCARRRGVDVGMNHKRAPGWHRGPGYGHGTGFHKAPPNYRH